MVRVVMVRVVMVSVALASTVVVGCSGEEAIPIDPANPPVVDTESPAITHIIPPTAEMERLARQQCLDDSSLDEGYVEAIDPNTDQVLSTATVDCGEVRAQG